MPGLTFGMGVYLTARHAADPRWSLYCVWDYFVLLGATAHQFSGGFLQSPATQPKPGKKKTNTFKLWAVDFFSQMLQRWRLNISLCYISQAPAGMINSHSFSSRTYFFDNPRRYDSDDDLSRGSNSRADLARWAHTNKVQTQSRVCFFNSTELKYTRTEKSILSLINSFSYPLPPSSSVKTFSQPPPISQSTLFHFPDRRI